jgi:hypothetical protein
MNIDGIDFNKEAMSNMSLEDFKKQFKGKFRTVDINDVAKLLGIKKPRRTYNKKVEVKEEE